MPCEPRLESTVIGNGCSAKSPNRRDLQILADSYTCAADSHYFDAPMTPQIKANGGDPVRIPGVGFPVGFKGSTFEALTAGALAGPSVVAPLQIGTLCRHWTLSTET